MRSSAGVVAVIRVLRAGVKVALRSGVKVALRSWRESSAPLWRESSAPLGVKVAHGRRLRDGSRGRAGRNGHLAPEPRPLTAVPFGMNRANRSSSSARPGAGAALAGARGAAGSASPRCCSRWRCAPGRSRWLPAPACRSPPRCWPSPPWCWALGLAGWAAAGPLTEQAKQLAERLPQGVAALRERLSGTGWGDWVLQQAEPGRLLNSGGAEGAAAVAAQAASSTLGGLGNLVLVVLVALYLAAQPGPYLGGLRGCSTRALTVRWRR